MVPLPIDAVLGEVVGALRPCHPGDEGAGGLVLVAEPGAGKTTRVPPAILKAELLSPEHPNVVLLQPRRVAARAAAARMAQENGWELGREVGYQIRFERRISSVTRLHVMTEGVLTRQLLDDPILEGVGCVILDEFHERSLHTDLAAALLREVRQTVRPDLRIVVMSATLEAEPVARFFGDVPIVRSAGRTFPVTIEHAGAVDRRDLPRRIAQLVDDIDDAGDVLVFLPGVGEINRTMDALEPVARRRDLLVVPLHGSLGGDEQFAALKPAPHGRRKVVVATNIAETSLTIDGVTTVIDSGLARVAGFDPRRGMDRLELKRISRASATQRAGRAGRTAPGRCVRLWSAMEDKSLEAFETPEVRRVDLAGTVLALHAWGHRDPRKFGWYEAPEERAIASAERLLEMLGATTSESGGAITEMGKMLLSLPVHPRLGRLLVAAAQSGCAREGAAIAALLSEKDILRPRMDVHPSERRPTTTGVSDLLIRLEALEAGRRDEGVDQGAVRQVIKARGELERVVARLGKRATGVSPVRMGETPMPLLSGSAGRMGETPMPLLEGMPVEERLLRLPLWAYPDRVCRRRGGDAAAGVMVGGGGVRLAPESVVRQHEFYVALDARQDERNLSREAIVHIASGIEMRWLEEMFPQEIRRQRTAVYDEQRDRVVGRGIVSYRDLVLREDKDAAVDDATASRVLAEYLGAERAWALFTSDEQSARWSMRVNMLGCAMPELNLPVVNDALIREVAAGACEGKRSLAEVRPALLGAMQGLLDYRQARALEIEAPESIEVPSGSRIRLEYRPSEISGERGKVQPPVLAVRLQELFGMTQTPRIAGGRVAVQLHLLGPNYRPVQITEDLASFWATTYFQVRKDLRVRYPKHSWPDDPLTATAQAKGRRR